MSKLQIEFNWLSIKLLSCSTTAAGESIDGKEKIIVNQIIFHNIKNTLHIGHAKRKRGTKFTKQVVLVPTYIKR